MCTITLSMSWKWHGIGIWFFREINRKSCIDYWLVSLSMSFGGHLSLAIDNIMSMTACCSCRNCGTLAQAFCGLLAIAGLLVLCEYSLHICLLLSFVQVARSTTIIFVVIFSVLILKRHVSKAVVTCCGLVACGFFLGIDQEKALGSLSVKGVVFGVLSSIFIALTGIYTKTALDVVNKDEVCIFLLFLGSSLVICWLS